MVSPVDMVFGAMARSICSVEYAEMLAKQDVTNEQHEREKSADEAFFAPLQWGDPTVPTGMRYDPMMDCLVPIGLTRFDPSTKTRVPVTQEWIDEAVAEIVRLNIELSAMPGTDPGVTLPEVDRIWEAVRAASAV